MKKYVCGLLVYGIILVLLCVVQPSGLAGLFEKGFARLREITLKKGEENAR